MNVPNPPHWTLNWCFGAFPTIWVHSGQFGCLTKLGAQRAELVQKFVPRNRVRIFRNECTRSTPLDSKLIFWCVLYYLVHLGLFGCHTKLRAKQAEVVQKFVPWNCVGIFWNECSRSTPLDPNLMFRCVLYYLCAFGTVWVRHNTQCKTGQTGARVSGMKLRRNFSQRTQPIQLIGPYAHVLICSVLFDRIWDRLVTLQKFVQKGPN